MRGLKCPLPALKTKKDSVQDGGRRGPGRSNAPTRWRPIDIPNLIRETGDTIEGSTKKGRVLTFRIRKT